MTDDDPPKTPPAGAAREDDPNDFGMFGPTESERVLLERSRKSEERIIQSITSAIESRPPGDDPIVHRRLMSRSSARGGPARHDRI
jgi:hypothetical protein